MYVVSAWDAACVRVPSISFSLASSNAIVMFASCFWVLNVVTCRSLGQSAIVLAGEAYLGLFPRKPQRLDDRRR